MMRNALPLVHASKLSADLAKLVAGYCQYPSFYDFCQANRNKLLAHQAARQWRRSPGKPVIFTNDCSIFVIESPNSPRATLLQKARQLRHKVLQSTYLFDGVVRRGGLVEICADTKETWRAPPYQIANHPRLVIVLDVDVVLRSAKVPFVDSPFHDSATPYFVVTLTNWTEDGMDHLEDVDRMAQDAIRRFAPRSRQRVLPLLPTADEADEADEAHEAHEAVRAKRNMLRIKTKNVLQARNAKGQRADVWINKVCVCRNIEGDFKCSLRGDILRVTQDYSPSRRYSWIFN